MLMILADAIIGFHAVLHQSARPMPMALPTAPRVAIISDSRGHMLVAADKRL